MACSRVRHKRTEVPPMVASVANSRGGKARGSEFNRTNGTQWCVDHADHEMRGHGSADLVQPHDC
jgi:hypothetical protein